MQSQTWKGWRRQLPQLLPGPGPGWEPRRSGAGRHVGTLRPRARASAGPVAGLAEGEAAARTGCRAATLGTQVPGSSCPPTGPRSPRGGQTGTPCREEARRLFPLPSPGPRAPCPAGVGSSFRTQEVSAGRGLRSSLAVSLCIQEETGHMGLSPQLLIP